MVGRMEALPVPAGRDWTNRKRRTSGKRKQAGWRSEKSRFAALGKITRRTVPSGTTCCDGQKKKLKNATFGCRLSHIGFTEHYSAVLEGPRSEERRVGKAGR